MRKRLSHWLSAALLAPLFAFIPSVWIPALIPAARATTLNTLTAPTSVTQASTTYGQVVVTWGAPAALGGNTISNYEVDTSSNGTTWTVASNTIASSATSYTVTGLTPNSAYYVRVAAIASGGTGAFGYPWTKIYSISNPTRNSSNALVYDTGYGLATLTGQAANTYASTAFSRVQYRFTFNGGNSYTYADFNKFAANTNVKLADGSTSNMQSSAATISSIAVPDLVTPFIVQTDVSDMNVYSSMSGLDATSANGHLEIWPYDYSYFQNPNYSSLGSNSVYDVSDEPNTNGSAGVPGGVYGSFQVFNTNTSAGVTDIAWNHHTNGQLPDLGIGTNNGTGASSSTGTTCPAGTSNSASSYPDFTFCGVSGTAETTLESNFNVQALINAPITVSSSSVITYNANNSTANFPNNTNGSWTSTALTTTTQTITNTTATNSLLIPNGVTNNGYTYAGWNTNQAGTGTNYPGVINDLSNIPAPQVWAQGANLSGTTWTATSGSSPTYNGSVAPTLSTESGADGATGTFKYVSGGTSTSFRVGSINTGSFTLCAVVRMTDNQHYARIFQLSGNGSTNWLSGYWGGYMDAYYHLGWAVPDHKVAADTNWHISCDSPNTYYWDGTEQTPSGYGGTVSDTLYLNTGFAEYSDWGVADMMLFNTSLTNVQVEQIEKYYVSVYGITAAKNGLAALSPSVVPLTTSATTTYQAAGNTTLYAQWNSTVSYSLNGGSGSVPATVSVSPTASITLPANGGYTLSGKQFDGWYTNAAGTGGTWYAPGATYTPNGNITLYAYWGTTQTISGATSYSFGVGTSGRTDTHTATGGTGSFTFSASGMPSGMTLDTSTANGFALVLNGTTAANTYTVTVTATDTGLQQSTQVITVYVPAVLKFTQTTQSFTATFGASGSIAISTTGGSTLKSISMNSLAAPASSFISLTSSSFSSAGTATINVAAGLPVGVYVETLSGVDGSVHATDVVTITINPLPYITYPSAGPLPTFTSGASLNWDFSNTSSYAGSGLTVTDLSGNGNTGTFASSPSYSYNTNQGAYVAFAANQSLTSPIMSALAIPSGKSYGPYSRFGWVYPTGNGVIWGIEDNNSWNDYQTAEVEYSSGTFNFFTYPMTSLSLAATINHWHYVGLTYDGTTSTAYVDGVSIGSTTTGGTRYQPPAEVVTFGHSQPTFRVTGAAGNFDLGQFAFWRSALTAQQVANNFEATEGKYLLQQYTSTSNINTNTVYMTSGTADNFSYVTPQQGTGSYTWNQSLSAGNSYISLDTTTNPGLATIRVAAGIPYSTYVSNITATDSAGVSNYPFTTNIVVNQAIALSASPSSISTTAGTAASTSITISNGTLNSGATYTYTTAASATNTGITWNTSANPVVLNVGTLATQGTYYETLTATDSVGASTSLGITVVIAPALTIAGASGSSISTTVTKASALTINVQNGTLTRTVSFTGASGSTCPSTAGAFSLSATSLASGTNSTTFTAGAALPAGNYQCVIKAVDSAGAQSTTTINIAVNPWPNYSINNGLIAYYDSANTASYSGSGSTWNNLGSMGTSENATFVATPSYSTSSSLYSTSQGGLTFNGSSNYATIPNPGALTNYTVSVWANPSTVPGAGTTPNPAFVAEQYTGSTKINYSLWMYNGGVCAGYYSGSTWIYAGSSSCYSISANNWYNFIYTVSGSGSSYTSCLYEATLTSAPALLNGPSCSTSSTAPGTNGYSINIGKRWDAAEYVAGQIPVVMIYNQALTSTQITQNYNEMVQRFTSSGSQPAASVTTTQGVATSFSDSANLGNSSLSYALGTAPSGISLTTGTGTSYTVNAANTLTSTSITQAKNYFATVVGTDGSSATTSATYQVTVNPPIIITSASTTPTGTAGVAITDAISASQGTGASTFTISPAINGITLTSTGTGTASLATSTSLSAGTYVETVTAKDTVGATTQQAYTFSVNPAPTVSGPVTINCTTGSNYRSALFTATNGTGTLNFGISPALTGVSVSSASGTTFYVTVNASGPAVGTYSENVTATDSKGAVGTWQITLKVNPQVTISNAANISINYGDSLSQTYTTSGGSGTLYFSGSGSSSSLCPVIEGTDHSNSSNTYDEIYGVGSCVWQTPTGVSSGRVLMVGGGGAGGGGIGGGGGAGEYIDNSSLPLSGAMTVTIGAGGTGVSGNQGGNGGNTTFGGVTAYGGGGGGGSGGSNGTQNGATNTYGSGGGGSYWGTGGSPSTDSTANSYSHAGGSGTNGGGGTATAGGGGGASAAGSNGNASTQSGGAGAAGYQSAIDLVNYAGGGGGGFNGDANVPANRSTGSVGAGGTGGGGAGGPIPGGSGNNGTPGTGGGGGGASNGSNGGKGGSGAVVISYLTSAVTANNKMSMKVTNNTAGTGTVVLDIPAGIQAGTTVTQYLSAVDSSGTSGGSVSFTITINKAPGTVALSIPGGATSTPYGFAVTISATTNTPGTVAFAYGGTALSGCGSVSTSNNVATCSWTPSVLNAGASLTAALTPTDTTDYTTTGVGTIANFAVVQAPAVIFAAPTQTFTYTGSPISDLPLSSPSNLSNLDRLGSVTLSYQGTGGTTYGPSSTAPTNAGTYSVIVTSMSNGTTASGTPNAVSPFNPANYVSFTYQAGTMTINRAALSATISYGDTSTATATYLASGTYNPILTTTTDATPTYSADNTSVCGINSSSGLLTTNAVGTCTVSVIFPQGTNYLGGTITRLVTINRAPRTFTLSSSASTLKYGDTATISSVITPSGTLAQTEGVITYSLAATSACSFNSSTMVVTALSSTGSCLITGTITQGDHYLSVNASAPSLTLHTAVAPTISYNAVPTVSFTNAPAIFALTPTITGLKFSDVLGGVTPIYTGTGSTAYASSTTPPTHGGTYSIAPSAWTLSTGVTSNYDTPTYTAVNATIAPIAQQAIVDNQSMSAASTPFQLGYTGGSSGGTATYQVTGGTASGCTVNSSGILNALSQGTCTVLVTLPATSDYNAVTLSITVTVAQYVNYAAQVVVSSAPTQIGGGIANQGIVSQGPAACTSGCAPVITEIDNSTGTAITSATMGDQVTIVGSGFTGATLIRWGRSAITNINVNSDTSITFVIPSGIALTSYQVKVQTPVGLSPAATLNITG